MLWIGRPRHRGSGLGASGGLGVEFFNAGCWRSHGDSSSGGDLLAVAEQRFFPCVGLESLGPVAG